MTLPPPAPWPSRWQRFASAFGRAFRRYANWLVGISWKKFLLLSVLLLVLASVLQSLPPFSWRITETVEQPASSHERSSERARPREPVVRIEKPRAGASEPQTVHVTIGGQRVITITSDAPPAAASAPAAPASAQAGASAPAAPATEGAGASGPAATSQAPAAPTGAGPAPTPNRAPAVTITLPPGAASDEVREAIREAVQDVEDELRQAAEDAAESAAPETIRRTRVVHWGDFLPELALLWIVASAIIKISTKGRLQAEVKAAQAEETAEAEALKRQVVEARMAAMQAQVEPHFLFNTLASIDHLIETDPPRASQMQKHLIALLRASMPTMREASAQGHGARRDLGRELAVIRPYLEILKVRMEDRLATAVDVPEGLLSAEFPTMMIQTLVENAIKHGLEPKPEGGSLTVKAEVRHGKLAVSVADTGLGFGQAPTAGTGVGLANVRERLQLLYGNRASLTVAENPGGGTVVTITVPYQTVETASA